MITIRDTLSVCYNGDVFVMSQSINNSLQYTPTPKLSKYEWTSDLDGFLISEMESHKGSRSYWPKIAILVKDKFNQDIPAHALRHHYLEITSSAKKGPLSIEEKQQVLYQVLQHGTKWKVIGPHLNRTQVAVRNCFRHIINKNNYLTNLINNEPSLFPQGAATVIRTLKDIESKVRRNPIPKEKSLRVKNQKVNSKSTPLDEQQNQTLASAPSPNGPSSSGPSYSRASSNAPSRPNRNASSNMQFPQSHFAAPLPIINNSSYAIMNNTGMNNDAMNPHVVNNSTLNSTGGDDNSLNAFPSFESVLNPEEGNSSDEFLKYLNM